MTAHDALIASHANRHALVDPSDYCRECGGARGERITTERNTTLWEPCRQCLGTGFRSVLVGRA